MQKNTAAVPDQTRIEFVILIADQVLVEQPDPLEHLASEAAEGDGIHPARVPRPDAEVGIADTEWMR